MFVSQTYLFLSLGLNQLGLGVWLQCNYCVADFKMSNFEFTALILAKRVSSDLYLEFWNNKI